ARLGGLVDIPVLPVVGLASKMGNLPGAARGEPGFLVLARGPLKPDGPLLADMTLSGITLDRLADRRRMLASMDRFRRSVDSLKGMDELSQRAFDILTSNKLVQALDVTKEDPKVRARYGKGRMEPVDDGGPMINDHFLMARRLVEAGARCVTLAYGRWDYHGANFSQCKSYLPMLDQAVSALVQD